MTGRRWVGVALLAVLTVLPAGRAVGEVPSFKNRPAGQSDKVFADSVGRAVVTAAHGTAKKLALVDCKVTEPKPNRKELHIKMRYAGAVTGAVSDKRYTADIVVKVDTTNKDAPEVLNIEYNDDNTVPHNTTKIQALIKEFTR
jgi:hypothetical protein